MKKLTALLLFFLIPVLIFAQVKVGTNFKVTAALPIDNRTVFSTIEARNALLSSYRYDGLMVYVAADSSNYQLKGGIGNASWVKISTSTGSTIDTTQIAYKNKANTFVKPQTFDSAVYLKNITNGTATDAFITVYSNKLRKYVVDWNSFATTATVYWDQTALGNALYPKAPANKMLIDNTATGTMGTDSINALIYGDFLKNTLRFNGSTTTKQNSSIGGNLTVNGGASITNTANIGAVALIQSPPPLGSSATFLARGIGGLISEVSTDSLVVTTDTTWKKDGAGIYNSNLGSVEVKHDLIVDSIPALSGIADTVLTVSPGDGTIRKQKAKTTVSNWTIKSSKIYPTVKHTIYSPISLNVAGMTIGTGFKDDSTSIAIGINALGGSSDLFNIGIGARAGYGLDKTSTYNTIIGSENINTGSLHVENSTIIGNNNLCISTGNVTGSILLGNSIDNDNLTSRLIIDSEYDKHSYGLIEGDFQNRTVQVDGTLTVNTLNDASTTPSTLLSDESGVLVRTPYPILSNYWSEEGESGYLYPTNTDYGLLLQNELFINQSDTTPADGIRMWYTTGNLPNKISYTSSMYSSTSGMTLNSLRKVGNSGTWEPYPILLGPTTGTNAKVGINTSTPLYSLDVTGNARITSIDSIVSYYPTYYLTDSAGVIMKSSYGLRDMTWVRTGGNVQPYYPTDVVKVNNTLWAEGTYGYYPVGAIGAGTRMLWIPSKGAFRAGGTTSTEWDSTNIGSYSSAFGYKNKASGNYSTALGNSTTASGVEAVSLGLATTASGTNSFATGFNTNAASYLTTVFGRYNVGSASGVTTWIPTDPLIEVGNGANGASRRNTITLLKNGNLYLNDSVFLTKVYNGTTSDSILTKTPTGKIRKMPYPGAGYWTLSGNTLYPMNTNNVISNAGFYAVGGNGDINNSGDISSVDRTALLKHLAGTDTLTTIQRALANISGTGIPNRTDAEAMRAVYDGRQTLASARDTIQKSFGKAYNVDELGHAVIGDVSELYDNTDYNSPYQLDVRGSARIKGGSSLYFGDATTANLYALNADSLKTDDNFIAGQTLRVITVPRLSGDADSALVLGANNILSYKKLPVGSGGTGGIVSLQSQTNSYQTISTVSDANVTLSETSSGGNHQFTTGWNGVLPITRGGTNGSTKTVGFNNLSPAVSKGDIIYHNGTNNARLAVGTNGMFLKAVSGQPTWSNITISSVVGLQDTLNELQHEKDTATYDGTKYDIINYAEPKITAGATTKYWRGDKTWQTLNDNSTTNEGQLSVPSALGNVSYATIASNTPGSSYIRTLKGDGLKLYHNQIVGGSTVTETLEYSIDTNRVMVFSDTIQGSGKIATKKNLIDYAEPKITAGTSAQYWAGDKTWKTFPTISGDSSLWSISGNDIYSKNTGNVGIGDATPTNKLDVTSSGSITLASENTGSGTAIKGTSSSGIGIQGTSTSGYQFRFGNDKNTTYDSTMIMTSGGRVALGSLIADSNLTVDGSLHIRGNSNLAGKLKVGSTITLNSKEYTFPNSYGTNNQVLTTDGSGGLQWSAKEGTGGTSGITSINSQTGAAQTILGSTNIAVTNPGEDQHQIAVTGVIPVTNGGTGANTLTGVLFGNGASAVTAIALGTQGKFLKAGASAPVWDTIADASDKSRGLLKSADWSYFYAKEPAIATGNANYYWNGSKQWTAFNDNIANNEGFLSMSGDNNGVTLSSNTPFSGKVTYSPSLGLNMNYTSETVGGVIENQILYGIDTTKVVMFNDTLPKGQIATKYENLWSIINDESIARNAYYNQAGTVNIGTQTSTNSKLQVKGGIRADSLYSLGNVYIPGVGTSTSYDNIYVQDKTSGRVKLAAKSTTGGTVTSIAVTAPLQSTANPLTTTGTLSIRQGTGSIDGFIEHTDWTRFNGKPDLGTTYSTAARGYHRHDTLYVSKTYDTQSSKIAPYLMGYDSLNVTRVKFPSLKATLATGFLKVSNKGLVSVDNTTYQPLIQGTAGYLPKFTGTSTMGNSVIYQATLTSYLGIGKTTNIREQLDLTGNIALNPSGTTGRLYLNRSAISDATSYFLGYNSMTKVTALSMSSGDVNNKIQIGTSASSVFTPYWTMFQSGNVAIGSITDPGYKFSVTGTANITSNLTLGSSSTGYRFPTTSGTALQALRVENTDDEGIQNLEWFTPYADPLAVKGDILYRSATKTDKLALGSSGQVLTVYNGLPAWRNAATGFANPMTEVGDMMIQVASDGGGTEPTRLDLGANGTVLMSNGTIPEWKALPAGTSHDPATVNEATGMSITVGTQDIDQTPSSATTPGYLSAIKFRHFDSKAGITGTVNYLPKISSDTLLINSNISDDGTKVSIAKDVSVAKYIQLNSSPSTDSASGTIITMGVANGSATNDVTANKFVYVSSAGNVLTSDSTITKPVIGMSLDTKGGGASVTCRVLLNGFARCSSWNFQNIGDPVYLGANGEATQTPPTDTGEMVQIVGIATGATYMIVNPQLVTVILK